MPPPPAAKAPSFVLSARTVIVPLSLSLFNFGAEREADFKNLNALLSLLEKTSLSPCVQKEESARFAITLSLSLTELFLFLSVSGDCWESRRARVLFFFFRQRAKKNEKFSLRVSSFLVRLSP
jgi:hypothetical protein